ncbi:MAG: ABC transporter ATP-binding protein/permease [Gammaproteobacteria bacterium]|nr:ABC transporter ATP-binding protein/permease [Gammaproteobacteria bacterium]MDH5799510.1 ABC transporter ATP-binding protein/permease [Gammaproteobacteria bacterium]
MAGSSKKQLNPGLLRILRRFQPEIRQHLGLISLSFLALLGEVLFRLLEPWPLKFVFDRIIPVQAPDATPPESGLFQSMSPENLLIVAAIAVVIFAGLRALAAYGSTVGFALVGNRVLTEVRRKLYKHLQALSLSFHTKSRTGDLIVRMTGDVGLLQEVTVTAALPLLGNVLVLIGIIAVMFWLHWQLALISIAVVPLFWFATLRRSRSIREVSRKQRKTESALAATVAESFSAIKTVQALSLEQTFNDSFSSSAKKNLREGVKAKKLAAGLERYVDVLVAIATALVLWFGVSLVMKQQLTPGDLIVFLAYLKTAFKPLRNFAKFTGRLAKAAAAGERVVEILDLQPEVRDRDDARPAPALHGDIVFDKVAFFYEPEKPVLKNIQFSIRAGQSVALISPSGSGKTTLTGLLLRLYNPVAGRILIDGVDIQSYTIDSIRSQIGVVLQDTLLFAGSIRENIAFAAQDASEEQIQAAARLANAHDFITAMPDGYDTYVGERGVTLSNGQRQRIAIARAAICENRILILDEPTTGLDKESEREVITALEKLAENKTTFLVTHDLKIASRADIILHLKDGEVHELGSHEELVANSGSYASLYRLQNLS